MMKNAFINRHGPLKLIINPSKPNLSRKTSYSFKQNKQTQVIKSRPKEVQKFCQIEESFQPQIPSNKILQQKPLSVGHNSVDSLKKGNNKKRFQENPNFRVKQNRLKLKIEMKESMIVDKKSGNVENPSDEQTKQIKIKKLVNKLFNHIVENSKHHGRLTQNSFLVKKQVFSLNVVCLIKHLISSPALQKEHCPLINSNSLIQKIKEYHETKQFQEKKKQLNFKARAVYIQVIAEDLDSKRKQQRMIIQLLKIQKNRLQTQRNNIRQQINSLNVFYADRKDELSQMQQEIYNLKGRIERQRAQYQQIKQKRENEQLEFKKIKQRSQQILNFVQKQQQKKILHWVSEAYKKIQTEIYGYASQLQCNAIASSLTWEPKPFRAVQEWTMKEMQRINKFILEEGHKIQEKQFAMRDFVLNTMRKFKAKDEQMMKITDFKTECVKKFIAMMQKWMENWELKQQYLITLREQFAASSQKINGLLKKALQKEAPNIVQGSQPSLLIQINNYWKKVQINYKYGNSFY